MEGGEDMEIEVNALQLLPAEELIGLANCQKTCGILTCDVKYSCTLMSVQ
ncbi:ALQxL family class IV lanthipeptide [Pseudonocardia sp. GCM10023141]